METLAQEEEEGGEEGEGRIDKGEAREGVSKHAVSRRVECSRDKEERPSSKYSLGPHL